MIVLGTITAAIITGQNSSVAVESKVSANQDARTALEGDGSGGPDGIVQPELRDRSCGRTAHAVCRRIRAARASSRPQRRRSRWLWDTDDSGVFGDGANEIITYGYDSANRRITRTADCGTTGSFLGEITEASGLPRTVRVVNDDAGISVFQYYDGNGDLIGDPASNIANIRRVEITLVVDTDQVDPNSKERRRSIYKTSVIPRNHPIARP